MNKRGGLVLRDLMFMLVIFGAVLSLSSIFVWSMADEYSNEEMNTEYYGEDSIGNLGDSIFVNVSSDLETMKNSTKGEEGLLGSFSSFNSVIKGATTILGTVLKSPIIAGRALTSMTTALSIPSPLPKIIGATITALIYILVIFVIGSALLRGGKI